ncbi:MAG TPA: hypothetical protein H9870_07895 [Candidatus Corynebacterium avicola]|uniref:Uncharacterized protein n=1 Tax=Candidatus Corynebacterium avicola TaxID=2838527 RepID=A0A9D1RQA9_9CORY|nr:hypothetical protein [Candidatus Corynebacterium avicola]
MRENTPHIPPKNPSSGRISSQLGWLIGIPLFCIVLGWATVCLGAQIIQLNGKQYNYDIPCIVNQRDGFSIDQDYSNLQECAYFEIGNGKVDMNALHIIASQEEQGTNSESPISMFQLKDGFRPFLALNLSYSNVLAIIAIATTMSIAFATHSLSVNSSLKSIELKSRSKTNNKFKPARASAWPSRPAPPRPDESAARQFSMLQSVNGINLLIGLSLGISSFVLTVLFAASEIASRPFVTGSFSPWEKTGWDAAIELLAELTHPRYLLPAFFSIAIIVLVVYSLWLGNDQKIKETRERVLQIKTRQWRSFVRSQRAPQTDLFSLWERFPTRTRFTTWILAVAMFFVMLIALPILISFPVVKVTSPGYTSLLAMASMFSLFAAYFLSEIVARYYWGIADSSTIVSLVPLILMTVASTLPGLLALSVHGDIENPIFSITFLFTIPVVYCSSSLLFTYYACKLYTSIAIRKGGNALLAVFFPMVSMVMSDVSRRLDPNTRS